MAMTTAMLRSLNLIEALAFCGYVGWYIWRLQTSAWSSWIVCPVWLAARFVIHRDTPNTMGGRADNLWSATKRSAVIFAPCIGGLCLAGILLGAWHRPLNHLFVPRHFFGYMDFCLLQQVGLNSYLTNRLLAATGSPARAALLAGIIFATLHWPNPVLIPLTFIGGVAMAWLFARVRIFIRIAVWHGILGSLVFCSFSVAFLHSLCLRSV